MQLLAALLSLAASGTRLSASLCSFEPTLDCFVQMMSLTILLAYEERSLLYRLVKKVSGARVVCPLRIRVLEGKVSVHAESQRENQELPPYAQNKYDS